MAPENLFAGAYLDRRAEARLSEAWLEEAQADPSTYYLAMRSGAALTRPARDGQPAHIVLLTAEDPRVAAAMTRAAAAAATSVLLGWFRERRVVLLDLPDEVPINEPDETLAELRPLAGDLQPAEAGLLAYARALHLWHSTHRHCGRCGAPTVSERAGHVRHCHNCGQQSFPRLDPAVIVLVHDGERALLGRQHNWAPNRYSTIAGFVEPGESLEDAVRREVAEETGINAHSIDYHSSQPWPFPSSLMLGFIAIGEHATPELRDGELEDARWLTREEIQAGVVQLPPPVSISRRLIDHWLHGKA